MIYSIATADRFGPRLRWARSITMSADSTFLPLSQAEAEQLCAEVRTANKGRWFSAARWQCWGCMRFTGGDPAKRCMGSQPGWRGCQLINDRQARREAA